MRAQPANGGFKNNFTDFTSISVPGSGESITNYLHTGGATGGPSFFCRIRLGP
jgi:hypothetical protein